MAGPNSALDPPSDDPFEQIPKTGGVGSPANDDDPFAAIPKTGGSQTSTGGAFARGVERNVVPAIGSLPAIGAGAEVGAWAGAPLAPFTAGLSVPVGGVLGGLAGAFLGSTALSIAQNWLLSKAPDSWKEKIGLDDRQEQLDASQHPYASFLGGVATYALTMRPGGLGKATALPDNATALQRIMANPVTARVFGGAAMGGMELGNEAASGESPDWAKVAISTGFGLIWNKPTRIGESIMNVGARPARALLGRPEPVAEVPATTPATEPVAPPAEVVPAGPPTTARQWNETILGQHPPTLAEAADLGVAGPGITEATFQGGHEVNPSAAMTAQETARTEASIIGPPAKPDPNEIARRIEPETFQQYDALVARREEFRKWINEYNEPPPELFQELEAQRASLQQQLDAHVASQNGYAGGKDARRLRAQLRDVESQRQDLADRGTRFLTGQAEETADLAMARKHLMATEFELRDLQPKIQAAYRRAAEWTGGDTYEHISPIKEELTTPAVASTPAEEAQNVRAEVFSERASVQPTPASPASQPATEGKPVAGTPALDAGAQAATPGAQPLPRTIEQQRDYIRNDVARQLIAAGRPAEEAQAAAAVEAAYYETRAARFGGKLGTPEELYNREGAEILRQGQKSQQGIVRQPREPRKIDETKLSLLQFLAHRGGISADEKNISDVRSLLGTDNKVIHGFGQLIRKGGMTLDRAREAAVEAGYLHDAAREHGGVSESTVNHLLDAMDGELRGNKVYRAGHEPQAGEVEGAPRPDDLQGGDYGQHEVPEPASELMSEADYAELFQEKQNAAPFYSAVGKAVDNVKLEKGSPEQWLGTIRNASGVKPEEMQWLGLEDWLKQQGKSVTKQQVQDYIRANQIEVKEVEKGEAPKLDWKQDDHGNWSTDGYWIKPEMMNGETRYAVYNKNNYVMLRPNTIERAKSYVESELAKGPMTDGDVIAFQDISREIWDKATPAERATMRQEAETFGRAGSPKFSQWQLPGGKNYRELLLTLPSREQSPYQLLPKNNGDLSGLQTRFANRDDAAAYYQTLSQDQKYNSEIGPVNRGPDFKSTHYDEPNILSHIRFNDRTIDGKKTLFVEEIQSDWHQKGRKIGYKEDADNANLVPVKKDGYWEVNRADGTFVTNVYEAHAATPELAIEEARRRIATEPNRIGGGDKVPNAPFKTTWPELALKRMIRYAAENGYDKVAWTPGEEQAKRYDLSKHISHIDHKPNGDGTFNVAAVDKSGDQVWHDDRATSQIVADNLGKEIAGKISNGEGSKARGRDFHTLEGVDLKVGGEGMLGFYDDILPNAANKLVKKFGGRVGQDRLPEGDHGEIYEREGGPFLGNARNQTDVEQARSEGRFVKLDQKGVPVHSLDINDDLRNAATQTGFPLFQGAQGGIVLNPQGLPGRDWLGSDNVKPIVRLMRDANASTFIHESGHKYLADLLRDAGHDEAPEGLKSDAATVQKWLGIDSPDDLAPRHHEKFARGFEQYLREGTAPSAQLASVFAKFKDWLVSIYQTLKGLGKPINEDIRGVFDRLLAEHPQRTVIAPETEIHPTLADIHAADAEHTEPAQAPAVQAQIDQERERAYSDHPEEVREIETQLARFYAENEQTNEPEGGSGATPVAGGQTGQGEGGLSEVQHGGEPAGPLTAGGGTGQELGTQRTSVSTAGGESGGLRGSNERAAGSGPESNPLAANPAHTFDTAESAAVDKAGNIRVENVTSVEGLAQAIHDSADRNGDFKAARGAMTEGQKVDLANELGLDVANIDEAKLGAMFGGIDNLAPKIWALRTLLRDSAQTVFDAMRKVKESNSDADAAAFAVAAARHDMIQGTVSKVTAEMGRGLGMGFKNLEGWEKAQDLGEFLKANTGRTLFQLKAMAKLGAQLDSSAKVSKFMRDAQKRSFGGMVLEYWINGLISGIATHVTYTAGNTALAANRMLLETPTAAIIGKLRASMGEQGAHVQLGEVGARATGLFRGLPAAMQASLEAARSGVTTLLPGEAGKPLMPFSGDNQLIVGKSATNEPVTWGEVKGDMSGMIRGLRDGIMATSELVKAGGAEGAPLVGAVQSPLGQIPDIAVKGVTVLPLGSAVRLPGRMIAAIHSFFRSANYSMEKAADAYRTAAAEGLTGEAFDNRVGQIWTNPTEERMDAYRHESTELTLMGQGSKFTQALSKLTNTPIGGVRWLKFVDPFVHIASNVIDQSIIKRTPLGLLSPELRTDLMGRPDPVTGKIDIAARDMAQARMLVGSALGITFAGLASQGLISGSGPKDPKESAMWRLAGNQAHSVRIGDTWIDVHRLGPLGMLLGISADMYDVAYTATHEDIVTAASHLQHAITQNILDESFMRGPSSLIQAIEDPTRYGQQYIENTLASFVPFSVGMAQMARAADPYTRQTRSIMDAIKAKVPSLSETLYPKRDIWGEPMPNLPSLGGRALSAFYEQKVSHDPVNMAMIQLGISPTQIERKIRNIDLTDEQHDDFARIAGRMTKQRLDAIVKSPDYQSWPNNIRSTVITEVIRQSREAARGVMFMKYPQLISDGTQAQKDRRMGVDAKSATKRAEMGR